MKTPSKVWFRDLALLRNEKKPEEVKARPRSKIEVEIPSLVKAGLSKSKLEN